MLDAVQKFDFNQLLKNRQLTGREEAAKLLD
jgi:hypothetical protein